MNEGIEDSSSDGRGSLKGFYSYKNTFDKDSIWLDIPKHGKALGTAILKGLMLNLCAD
jgi:hypothetical protein